MSDDFKSSKAYFALEVLNNLPGLAFRILNDGQWTFAYASEGARELLGYSPEELVSIVELRKMIPIEDQVANKRLLARLAPQNPYFRAIYRLYTADGELKWVREEAKGVFTGDGRLRYLDGFLVDITDQKIREEELETENEQLKDTLWKKNGLDNLIGRSEAMRGLFEMIMRAAGTEATVIVTGESGTGKELTSKAIHTYSSRCGGPFVVVNCGAIAESLLESEFFGYRKGAFTGAVQDRPGFLAAADKGTLFLDEIGEISKDLQVKLLRVLDGDGYIPVGETRTRHSDFRLIAATNRSLEELVRSGRMREDFYYRINTIRLRIPPLRERGDDVLLLADHFLKKYSGTDMAEDFSVQDRDRLRAHAWPGNVRELQNAVYRYLIQGRLELSDGLCAPHEPPVDETGGPAVKEDGDMAPGSGLAGAVTRLEEMEKKMVLESLERNRWHIGKTADELGISRRTMQRRMKKYGLK